VKIEPSKLMLKLRAYPKLLVGKGSSWEVSSLERNVWLDGCLETELKAGYDHTGWKSPSFQWWSLQCKGLLDGWKRVVSLL